MLTRSPLLFLLLSVLLLAASGDLHASRSEAAEADHARLRQHLFAQQPMALPSDGLTFERDVARWTLESGRLWPQAALGDGTVTGLIFEGQGRFEMEIPDWVELEQYRRMSGQPAATRVSEPFTRLILRTSESWLTERVGQAEGDYVENDFAADRMDNWAGKRGHDADSRVICGRAIPGDEYLRVEIETPERGWLTFDFDGQRSEEVQLSQFDRRTAFTEIWVSLDRESDRDESGRPSGERRSLIDVEHVRARADLTEASRSSGRVGWSRLQPRLGRFEVEVTFRALTDGPAALPLELTPWAEVKSVKNEEGQELTFFRDHRGDRLKTAGAELYDDDLAVLLATPLKAGETRRLSFEYELEVLNYVLGRSWYPGAEDAFMDLHTGTFELKLLKKHDVRSMGRLESEEEDGRFKLSIWEVETPAKMLTFSFAERFQEETVAQEGAPEVVAFSTIKSGTQKNKAFNVAADVSNSLKYFQWLFDDVLPNERLYATAIIGGHGQSFDGFLHLAEGTFQVESKGPSELFRAHEAAHQWWGHRIGWSTYRDQWLSEAFAEYSAILFLEATMEEGKKTYDEIVGAYSGISLGRYKKASRYIREWTMETNDKHRERLGPIGLGFRASTRDTPQGYFSQNYIKGSVVLHMLRTLLRNLSQSDDLFIQVLRDFVDAHGGGHASTADFVAILERRAPGDWLWFFDQWVLSARLPTYTWRWEAEDPGADGKVPVHLHVQQSGVAEGFKMPVPVAVDFGRGRQGQLVVVVDQPEKTFTFQLPARPKSLTFNPGNAVLATTTQKKKG